MADSVTLYVDPAGISLDIQEVMAGDFANNRKCVKVSTRNKKFDNGSAHLDMLELNAKLLYFTSITTASDPVWVVGHSRGTQIICKWIREMGPSSTINPNLVRFFMLGCPEQRYTGSIWQYPTQDKASYPGNLFPHNAQCPTPAEFHGGNGAGFGIPTSYQIPWKITFFANQFDGWADAPNLYNQSPIKDVTISPLGPKKYFVPGDLFCRLRTGAGNHDPKTYSTHINDAKNVSYIPPDQPNVTYIWIPKYPVPSAISSKWLRFWARKLDEERRPAWHACWTNRPVTIPMPDYPNIPSWIDYY